MKAPPRRIWWLVWGVAVALLLTASVTLGETPLVQSLRDRLSRRSAKAKIARTTLAQEAQSQALTFSPSGGYYDRDVNVELHTGTPNAKILFTTDGSLPTPQTGVLYERPIHLDSSQPNVVVLRAREVLTDSNQLGPVLSASYVMNVHTRLPVLSLVIDPADLTNLDAHYLSRGQEWERPIHLTYITPDHQTGFTQAAGLRILGRELQPLPKKSFWIYFRKEYGKGNLRYPLFGDGEVHTFDHLVLDASGNQADKSLRWTLLESEITAQLTREAGGEAPQGQFVVLFLNGQPWGIYDLRERLDDNYMRDHYNIQSADVIQTNSAQSGDLQNWNALYDFVDKNSLADPQNLAFLQTLVDLQNFTDYNIIQIYAAHDDWPQRNAVRARARITGGRWFWLSWDATRGYGATGTPNVQSLADPQSYLASHGVGDPDFDAVQWATRSYAITQHETAGWLKSTLLLRRLLENGGYRNAFISRANDLLNTTLSSESVLGQVERGAAQLASDIHYEENRWPSPFDWKTNIQEMRAWVQSRPDRMRRELMVNFGLTETVTLEFAPPLAGQGYVVVDDQPVRQLPWRGVYFSSIPVHVTAVPEPGYVFAGWDAPDLPATPDITLTASLTRTLTPRFAPAPAGAPRPNDAVINEVWINDNGARRYASLGGRPIEGDWFELLVVRDKLDMRGWRMTDNDSKTATDEGSLIFPRTPAFAAVPRGTVILVIATENESNAANFPKDELDASKGTVILYAGNGTLDTTTDPGFGLGRANDNLVLLAPGPTSAFADDVGIDFVAEGSTVTPASFGVLTDGVVFEHPFRGLGNDNGLVFTVNRTPGKAPPPGGNDDASDPTLGDDQPGPGGWIVDPGKMYTGDDITPGTKNILTPGQPNPGQAWALHWGK